MTFSFDWQFWSWRIFCNSSLSLMRWNFPIQQILVLSPPNLNNYFLIRPRKTKTTNKTDALFLFVILYAHNLCMVFSFNWNSVKAEFKGRVDLSQCTAATAAALPERCGCLTKKNVPLLFIAHHCYQLPFYCSGKDSRHFSVQTLCPQESLLSCLCLSKLHSSWAETIHLHSPHRHNWFEKACINKEMSLK